MLPVQFEKNIVGSFSEVQKLNNYCTITQSHLLFGETFIGESAKGSHDLQRRKSEIANFKASKEKLVH